MFIFSFRDSIVEFFNIDNNTFFTVFASLFVFIIGGVLTSLKVSYSRRQEFKNLRKLFQSNVNRFIWQVEKQADEFCNFSEKIGFYENVNFDYYRVTISSIAVFNHIGYMQTFNSYFRSNTLVFSKNHERKIENFSNIWNGAKQVEFWHDQADLSFSKFLNEYNDFNHKIDVVGKNWT